MYELYHLYNAWNVDSEPYSFLVVQNDDYFSKLINQKSSSY
ncbi:hypothetical protein THOG05_10247 [Vibrio rotiferianus]|nr:hypothetical protein THOG05_10247 [Vibrio rotiferianus]CAH1568611.1 hypothetical protein THOG10_190039 [Vibrio rotiferianus]CAH1570697.1 hypothetical protein THOB06_190039 [Vibrio rotiferianus]